MITIYFFKSGDGKARMSAAIVAAATSSYSQRSLLYITRPTSSLCLSVKVRAFRKVL